MILADLGLRAAQIVSGAFANPDNMNPDQLTQMYLGANQQVWWLMTTTKSYNSMAGEQGSIPPPSGHSC